MVVGVHPSIAPRLVRADLGGREDLVAYRAAGGYAPGRTGAALRGEISASGLRGRGGAAFPAGVKWEAVAGRPGPRYVVANGEEGEPTSLKDRYLLRMRPHLVLDGLLRAAEAVDADEAFVYLSDDEAAASITRAIAELRDDGAAHSAAAISVVAVEPSYVAGEESAAIRAIDGGPAKPVAKPPRPFEAGVRGAPTVVQNVETLANVPAIATHGAAEHRRLGTAGSTGTFLLTASGACGRPGVYEVPFGLSLEEAFADVAGDFSEEPGGFVMGGYFAGLLGERGRSLPLDYDALRTAGSGLGCAAITVLRRDECPVRTAATISAYFAGAGAEQCGVCIKGSAAMRDALERLCDAGSDASEIARLEGWSTSLRGRGACALLDGATTIVATLLREFPDDVAAHLRGACNRCHAISAVQPT